MKWRPPASQELIVRKIFTKYILDYPRSVIVLSLIITVFLASGIRKIRIEEDIKEMLPKDLPARQTLNELEDIFGGSDVMLVAIGNEEDTIFNKRTLSKIIDITDSLDVIQGITRVTSLATVKHIKGEEWGMEVTPFLEEVPETAEEIRVLKETFFEDSLYVGTMVSEDGRYAAIIAVLQEDAKAPEIYEEVSRLKQRLEEPEKIYLSGYPVTTTLAEQRIKSDIRRLIPFVFVVVIVILYLSLRTISGVFLPLLATIMGVVSMVGTMGHLDKPFMMVNNIMPVVLVAVGVAYGIHVIATYHEELKGSEDKKRALSTTIEKIGTPVIMAGLTTMVGFLSLVTAPLPVIREFGAFLAFGVFLVMLFSLTMVPAILLLLPAPKKKVSQAQPGLLDRLLTGIGHMVIGSRNWIIAMGIAMTIVFAFGIPLINIEMNPISFFPESSEVRQADAKVNEHLAGSINMNLLFSEDIASAEVLKAMDRVQQFLEQFPETGSTISLATIVKRINRVLHADDPQFERIPDTKEAVSQAILLYNVSGSPEDYEQYVDSSFENGQAIALMKSVGTKRIAKIAEETERFCRTNFKNHISIRITGILVFVKDLAQMVITSQARSLIFAALLVFILAWLTYRSWRIGVLSIIPLCVTIVINFGLMGFVGIDLSIPTAMISSIIIGIGIDYSFHFISRFKFYMRNNDTESSIVGAIRSVGQPILFNATATGFGFLVLMVSGFVPLRFMGFLIALTMMTCAFGALTVLASMLTFMERKECCK